jgi:hypothetical protein
MARLALRHAGEQPVPPREHSPAIPAYLSDLVLALLSKRPEDRPGSADLVALLRGRSAPGAAVAPPAPVTASLACASPAPGTIDLFLHNDPYPMSHLTYSRESSWSEWRQVNLPPGRVTAIAAGSRGTGHAEVAIAMGPVIHRRSRAPGQDAWTDWQPMPPLAAPGSGVAVLDLVLSSPADGHWSAFALVGGQIRHRRWDADADRLDWRDLPGPGRRPLTAIAAGSHADGRQELFAITGGEIWHTSWSRPPGMTPSYGGGGPSADAWEDWDMLPRLDSRRSRAVDIACSSLADGHLEVFALDASGRLSRRRLWRGTGWSSWQSMAGPGSRRGPVTAIAAGTRVDRQQELFARTTDGRVHHAWNWLGGDGPDPAARSEWSRWHELPAPS